MLLSLNCCFSVQSAEERRVGGRAGGVPRPAHGHADVGAGAAAVRHCHGPLRHPAPSTQQRHRPLQPAAAHRGPAASRYTP